MILMLKRDWKIGIFVNDTVQVTVPVNEIDVCKIK